MKNKKTNFIKLSIYLIDFNSNEKELNYSITTKELIYWHRHQMLLFLSLNLYFSNVYFLYCQLILLRKNKDSVCYVTRFFAISNIIFLIIPIIAWQKFHVNLGLFILIYYLPSSRLKKLCNMPGDSHLNSFLHKLMARYSIHLKHAIFT